MSRRTFSSKRFVSGATHSGRHSSVARFSRLIGSAPLSRFRYLTDNRTTGTFNRFWNKPLKQLERVSSRSGSQLYTAFSKTLSNSVLGSMVCKARKVRREVIFAKGKQGGNHKPPKYTLKSLVRCS